MLSLDDIFKNKSLKFKKQDKIIIYNIHGVELNIEPEGYGGFDFENNMNYHRIIGEFFYCGLLLDGQLILSEKNFNKIIKQLNLTVNIVDGSVMYFRNLNKKQLLKMQQMKLIARCIGDLECESETEEDYLFYLIR